MTANLRFAWWFARRYYGKGIPYDDLQQEAALALCEAVDQFDPVTYGNNIRTYAAWKIMRHLQTLCEKHSKFPRGTEFPLSLIPDREPTSQREERVINAIWDFVESLPEADQEILARRYGLGVPKLSVKEMKAKLGITGWRIRQSVSRSLKMLGLELREIA